MMMCLFLIMLFIIIIIGYIGKIMVQGEGVGFCKFRLLLPLVLTWRTCAKLSNFYNAIFYHSTVNAYSQVSVKDHGNKRCTSCSRCSRKRNRK